MPTLSIDSLNMNESNSPRVVALILAGGTGSRVGNERPKQYIEYGGESILARTLSAFRGLADAVFVVCRDEWADYVHAQAPGVHTVTAGSTGYESLRHGVAALGDAAGDTLVMIHDAVRPFVTPAIIADNLEIAQREGNAITAVPTYETLLHASSGYGVVRRMTRRENVYRAQTPQTFRLSTLRQMLSDAQSLCINDAQSACTLACQLGYELHLSTGEIKNFKITTLTDLQLYEALIP